MTRSAFIQTTCELAPVFVFFIAGQLFPFITSVVIFMGAIVVSLIVDWCFNRSVPVMPLVSGLITLVAGALTLYFDKPNAIIFADTLWYWGLAFIVAIGFWRKRHFLELMFDHTFAITRTGWNKLSIRWLLVLVVAGSANEYVRLTMTPEFWIDFRFTKVILLTLFSLYQFTLARRYRIEGESNTWGLRTSTT